MDDPAVASSKAAGRIAARARRMAVDGVREGASILVLADAIEAFIAEQGGGIAFPINISIDEQAAHYTPASGDVERVFERGQVVKLDVGAHVDGHIADTAATVEVGTSNWADLLRASEAALEAAIEIIGEAPLGVVGQAIEDAVVAHGYRPIENLTGHALGRFDLHAGLSVPNVSRPTREVVPQGTAVAIEPFASSGTGHVDGKAIGNIYLFKKKIPVKSQPTELLQGAMSGWPPLPFSERQCARIVTEPGRAIATLLRRRGIYGYAGLRDEPGSFVSQAEHTVIVLGGETIVTTR